MGRSWAAEGIPLDGTSSNGYKAGLDLAPPTASRMARRWSPVARFGSPSLTRQQNQGNLYDLCDFQNRESNKLFFAIACLRYFNNE